MTITVCRETHLTAALIPTEKLTTAKTKVRNSKISRGILRGVSVNIIENPSFRARRLDGRGKATSGGDRVSSTSLYLAHAHART